MSRVEAVVLDIDGTLLYSNDEHARAFLDAATELGLFVPAFERVRGLIGKGGDKLIPEAFGFDGESEEGLALDGRKGEIFRSRYLPTLRPTPGTRDLLERFRTEGLRMVVATSAGADDLKLLLDRAGVTDLLDSATSASDVEESKPEPDVVQAAIGKAGVDPSRAIMLGDTPYDIEAARKAGVSTIAVRSGGWGDAHLVGAVAIYDHPADLLARYEESPFRGASRKIRS